MISRLGLSQQGKTMRAPSISGHFTTMGYGLIPSDLTQMVWSFDRTIDLTMAETAIKSFTIQESSNPTTVLCRK